MKNKKILVYGLGVTGLSSIKALSKMGAEVYAYEDDLDKLKKTRQDLEDFDFEIVEDIGSFPLAKLDYLLKSPGIKMDNQVVQRALKLGLEVVSDVELAYRIYPSSNFIAVTGTNGKTTTTSILANILSQAGVKNKLVGNIGIGVLWEVYKNGLDCQYVLEVSSFQLASSSQIKPSLAAVLNISEDHLDWHGSFEAYKQAKLNLVRRQDEDDILIVNHDDPSSAYLRDYSRAKIYEVSLEEEVNGSYYKDGKLYCKSLGGFVLDRKDLRLVGDHNVENALFAIELAAHKGIGLEGVRRGLKTFHAIEHRIEPCGTIGGVTFYNDSKGTNVDSTLKALDGFDENLILIAGGYDKGADFSPLFKGRKLKSLILMGATRQKLKEAAEKEGIMDISMVENMDQAVSLAFSKADKEDKVLLSPACASWDMYKNYEERGRHFKKLVSDLHEREKN